MIQNLPLKSVVFCRKQSILPKALAIAAVALVVIGGARAYGVLPPSSNYGVAQGVVIIALGNLVGGLALYAHTLPNTILLSRKGTALFFTIYPDNQSAARSAKALLERFDIYKGSIIEVSSKGIQIDSVAKKLNQRELHFLQTLFDERRLPQQGLRIRVIDKSLQTASKPTPQLFRIPEELFPKILLYLPKCDRLNFAQCSSITFRLCQDQHLWRESEFPAGISLEKLHDLLCAFGRRIHKLTLYNKRLEASATLGLSPYDDEARYDSLMYRKVLKLVPFYCPHLKDLSLSSYCIDEETAEAMANSFRNFQNLESLNLHRNPVGNLGAIAIANRFESISSLLSLNLGCTKMATAEAEAISRNLCHLPNLEILELGNNRIGDPGVTAIANNLKHMPNLRELELRLNHFSTQGGKAIANNLRHINHLQTLSLNSNVLGDEGIGAIANGLQGVPDLISLTCEYTRMGLAGAKALADNLRHVTNLQRLEVGNNPIGDEGSMAIADNLCYTTNLTRLRMWTNDIGDEGAIALANNFSHITNLKCLVLWKNRIGDEGIAAIQNNLGHVLYLRELNLNEQQIGEVGV